MTVDTTKSVLSMQAGAYFKAFKGKVTKVGEVRAVGTGTVQDMHCEENGMKLKLSFWDHDSLPMSWEGRNIYVVASEQGKSLMYKNREYKDKFGKMRMDKSVSVPADAEITEAAAIQAPPVRGHAGLQAERDWLLPPPPIRNPVATPAEQPDRYAGRCANALLLSMRAATYVGKEFDKSSPGFVTPEDFTKLALGIFGAMERAGMIDRLPVGEMKARAAAAPPPPPPPPEEPEPEDPGPPADMPPENEDDSPVPF